MSGKGYTDLHLHLIPAVDDGCRSLDESLAMAKALVSLGFVRAAPSPHHRPEYATVEVARQRLDELKAALTSHAVPLELFVNAEHFFLDDTLITGLPTARKLGGNTMLVEAPYTSALPMLTEIIFRMKVKGVTPLIAHPERCLEFEKKGSAEAAVNAGALLQLDLGAIVGRYGRAAQKLARRFLDDGLYAVAATDLHSPVGAEDWVGAAIEALGKGWGPKVLQTLLADNPGALLRGEPIVLI
ncbi:MAG: protein-tyrosine-phosphatase [Myxococcaceae bacterium]|nr:protein-tyrosine-phosphatase [Myxococcaceae bacterium]